MSLDTLPAELIDTICSYCKFDEIRNLRQTCRCLRQVADEHLFPRIQLFMTNKSLGICTQIAKHPVFRKSLKEIWVRGDRPRFKPYELWQESAEWEWERLATNGSYNQHLMDELERYQPAAAECTLTLREKFDKRREIEQEMKEEGRRRYPPLSDAQLRHHYEIYMSRTREAEQMLRDGTYHDCLRAVFEHCVNLQDVYYAIGSSIHRVTRREIAEHLQEALLHPEALGEPDERYRDGIDGMTELVRAASGARFKPSRLSLGAVCHYLLPRLPSEVSDQLPTFMEDLEYLHWTFPSPLYCEDDGGDIDIMTADFQTGALVKLKRHTTKLQTLQLDMTGAVTMKACRPALSDIVGDIIWKNLRAFKMYEVETSSDDLVQFLLRHSDTLEDVSLQYIWLTTSTWPACLGAFAGKLKALRSVKLTGILGHSNQGQFCQFSSLSEASNGYAQQLTDYILHGNAEFPHPPAIIL